MATGPTTVGFKPRAKVSQLATHSSWIPPTDSTQAPRPLLTQSPAQEVRHLKLTLESVIPPGVGHRLPQVHSLQLSLAGLANQP